MKFVKKKSGDGGGWWVVVMKNKIRCVPMGLCFH